MKIMPEEKNGYVNKRQMPWISLAELPSISNEKNGTHIQEINQLQFQASVNSAPE